MNIQRQLLIAALCLIGTNNASAQQSQRVDGVIRFHGLIVESSCMAGAASQSFVDLVGCPQANAKQMVSVRSVDPVVAAKEPRANVTARLIDDTRPQEQYYSQRYQLTDSAGKLVKSGNYVVTLTMP